MPHSPSRRASRPTQSHSLTRVLKKFKGKRILVIGDLILDEYAWGDVSRISQEAPVPVVELMRQTKMPGGASYVASLIRHLDAECDVVGVVGHDEGGRQLKDLLKGLGVNTQGMVVDSQRPTTLKTRVMAQRQQVVRLDREAKFPLSKEMMRRVVSEAKRWLRKADAVILSDYAKGVLTPPVFDEIIRMTRQRGVPITVDPKPAQCLHYRNVTAITPNTAEAGAAVGMSLDPKDDRTLVKVGKLLLAELNSPCVLITRGEHGMSLFERTGRIHHIPTMAREVFDVSGAGDTVISTLTLALAAGGDYVEAAKLANVAAGVQVAKLGTEKVTRAEIVAALDRSV